MNNPKNPSERKPDHILEKIEWPTFPFHQPSKKSKITSRSSIQFPRRGNHYLRMGGGAAAAQAVLPQRSATRTTQSAPDAPISNSPPVDGGPKSGVDGFQGLVIPLGGIKTGPAEYERIAQDDKTTSGRRGHEALRPRQARFSDRRRRVSGRQRQRTTAPSVAAKGSGKGNKRK